MTTFLLTKNWEKSKLMLFFQYHRSKHYTKGKHPWYSISICYKSLHFDLLLDVCIFLIQNWQSLTSFNTAVTAFPVAQTIMCFRGGTPNVWGAFICTTRSRSLHHTWTTVIGLNSKLKTWSSKIMLIIIKTKSKKKEDLFYKQIIILKLLKRSFSTQYLFNVFSSFCPSTRKRFNWS